MQEGGKILDNLKLAAICFTLEHKVPRWTLHSACTVCSIKIFCVNGASCCCHFYQYTSVGFGRSADHISTFVDEVFAGSVVSTVICLQCHTVCVCVSSVRTLYVCMPCLFVRTYVYYLSKHDYYCISCYVLLNSTFHTYLIHTAVFAGVHYT